MEAKAMQRAAAEASKPPKPPRPPPAKYPAQGSMKSVL
jgi:hypothetical protein